MEISSILIGLILFGASLFFVSAPFRKKYRKDAQIPKLHVKKEERREVVLSALRDLDFDFKTGKVDEEDYTPLRAQLMVEAAQYIKQQQEEDKKLETLIQTRRAMHQQSIKCDQCGSSVETDQHFCAKCGSPINHELCSQCGRKIRKGDQFCSSCGNRLEVRVEAVAQA